MANPTLAPLVWQADSNAVQAERFLQDLAASPAYLAELRPYGLESMSYAAGTPSTGALPTTLSDTDVRAALRASIAANPSVSDATLESTIFVLVIPEGTTYTLGSGTTEDTLCTQLGGYHSFLTIADGGNPIVYAVVEECALAAPYPTNVLDAATLFLSHEIAEAITDPQAFDLDPTDDAPSNPAYLAPSDLSTFLVLGQGEVADLCAFPFAYYRDSSNYLEQHLWSNAAAQAGQDPCGAPIYRGVAPLPGETQSLSLTGLPAGYSVSGLSIPVGTTQTISLGFFSSAPQAPWVMSAVDAALLTGSPDNLTLGLSGNSGQNGDQVQLQITVNRAGNQGGVAGLEGVVLTSDWASPDGGGSLWTILIESQ